MAFERRFQVGWNNLDANAHMTNTAYLEMGANVRIMYFHSAGFSAESFRELPIGPVMKSEELWKDDTGRGTPHHHPDAGLRGHPETERGVTGNP